MKLTQTINDNFLVECIVEVPTTSFGLILSKDEKETNYGIVISGPKYVGKEVTIKEKKNRVELDNKIYYIIKELDISSVAP